MSEWIEWTKSVLLKILEWAIIFTLGLLFRKRVGRFLIKAKSWLLNDSITIKIVSVHSYTPLEIPVEIRDFSLEVFEDIRVRIPNPKLLDIFPDGLRVNVPTFGILRLNVDRIRDEEDIENHTETTERIKMTLQPESPVRLGIREVKLLSTFTQFAETLFSVAERLIVTRNRIMQDYTILEFPRLGRFVEEKTFEIDDEDLGAHVHATPTKLSIVVSPTSQIADATRKYLLA